MHQGWKVGSARSLKLFLTSDRLEISGKPDGENQASFDPYKEIKSQMGKELSVIQTAEVDLTPIIESRLFLEKCIQEVEQLLQASSVSGPPADLGVEKHEDFSNQSQLPDHLSAMEMTKSQYSDIHTSAPQQQPNSSKKNRSKSPKQGKTSNPAQPEIRPWKHMEPFAGHLATLRSVIFISPKMVVTGGDDGTVKRWNLGLCKNGKKQGGSIVTVTHRGHQGAVSALAFDSITGRVFSTGQDQTIRVWGNEVPPLGQLLGHQGLVWDLAIDVPSRLLASASSDGTVKIWDISKEDYEDDCLVMTIGYDEGESSETSSIPTATAVTFIENGSKLVIGYDNAAIHIINLKENVVLREISNTLDSLGLQAAGGQDPQAAPDLTVNGITYLPTHNTIITAHPCGLIRVFDLGTGALVKEWWAHEGGACCVALSPDFKELMTGGSEGLVKFWNVEQDYKETQTLEVHDIDATEGVLHVGYYNAQECGQKINEQYLAASVGGDTRLHVYEK